ncbi:MAG: hypothetical protein LE178_01645 [Endomicrobium sp.]|nr:hypothetical protein [Endomicrobium sp.]
MISGINLTKLVAKLTREQAEKNKLKAKGNFPSTPIRTTPKINDFAERVKKAKSIEELDKIEEEWYNRSL